MAATAARAQHDTATLLAARADARSQAGLTAPAMPYVPAATTPFPPEGVSPALLTWAETVAAGGYTHRSLARGSRVRLTDVTGEACAHLLAYNAVQPSEQLNVADTRKIPWQAYLGAGHPLLSGDGRVLATIAADSSGRHDALCGTSTAAANQAKYGDGAPHGPSPAGRELFVLAAAKHGLGPRDLPPSVSFFQGVRVAAGGSLEFTGSAGPGASVDLIAELPLIVLIANVPHPADPRPGYSCGLLRVHAWRGQPSGPGDPWFSALPEVRRAYLNTLDYAAARGL